MKSTSELAMKTEKAKVCFELAQFLVAWLGYSPVLGSLSFGLELDIIYVTKIRLGSFFENIWWMDLKHKTDFEYWLFDFRFGLWKKKKKIWQVGIPMTSFMEGWSSSWSPFASWPWRIETWSLNFQGWNANR